MTINKFRFRILIGAFTLLLLVLAWGSTAAESQAADAMWDARYWNNKDLAGNPVLQRVESDVNYDWGNGSPAAGIVNNDNFSAHWRRAIYFSGGNYRFTATTDDGMRVWIDGSLLIDSWMDGPVRAISKDVYLYAGDHQVEVKYYEAGGQALARLSWTAVGGSAPAPTAAWKGEYYNNMSLSGAPALVRDDANLNFDWGAGSPAWGKIASDQFSVRWRRTLSLQPGRNRFTVIADDGARLWVNGQLVIDQWHDSLAGTYFAEVDLPGGQAVVQMEYFENVGGAVARLGWEWIGGGANNKWRGEYFNNKTLSGSPVLVRDDANLNFNWGTGAPAAGVPADGFSVRWTRQIFFNSGRYRFTATSDDGVRVWVNNQQIINAWSDHPVQSFNGEIDLSAGTVTVRVEYYESTGGAQMQLSWLQIPAAPQPAPTPAPPASATGVVQSALLNVRHGPGFQYGVITQLVRGQTVTLAGYRGATGNWVMINWNGSTAWVSSLPAYLATSVPVNSLPVWQGTVPNTGGGGAPTGATATVARAYFLNVRTGPGTAHSIIKAVPLGTTVTLLGRNAAASWAKVQLADGTVGWMSANYLNASVSLNSLPIVN